MLKKAGVLLIQQVKCTQIENDTKAARMIKNLIKVIKFHTKFRYQIFFGYVMVAILNVFVFYLKQGNKLPFSCFVVFVIS